MYFVFHIRNYILFFIILIGNYANTTHYASFIKTAEQTISDAEITKQNRVFIDELTMRQLAPLDNFNRLFTTIAPRTKLGLALCYQRIMTPTNDISLLELRQQLITYLSQNPELQATLETLCTDLTADDESTTIALTSNDESSHAPLFCSNSLIPSQLQSIINQTPTRLATWQIIPFLGNLTLQMFDPLQHIATPFLMWLSLGSAKKCHGHAHNHSPKEKTGKHDHNHSSCQHNHGLITPILALYSLYQIGMASWNHYQDVSTQYQTAYEQITHVRKLCSCITACNQIFSNHPQLKLLGYQPTSKHHTLIKEVMNLSQTITSPMHIGSIARLQYLLTMPEVKQELTHMLYTISRIDLYASLARALVNKQITLPSFQTSRAPLFELIQGIRPNGLNTEVANDFIYQQKPLIMTGPGGSGKSEYLHMIASNAILAAQGLGVIPQNNDHTTSLRMTPFDYCFMHANISDIRGRYSSSQAEALRFAQIKQYMENNLDKQGLIIFDEPLKHTDPEEACTILIDIVELFKQYPKSIACYATHYKAIASKDEYDQRSIKTDIDGSSCYHVQAGPNITTNLYRQLATALGSKFNKHQPLTDSIDTASLAEETQNSDLDTNATRQKYTQDI